MKILAISNELDLPEARLFEQFARDAQEVVLVCRKQAAHKELLSEAGVEIVEIEFGSRFDLKAILSLRKLVQELQPDLIHYFSSRAISNGLLATTGIKVPQVAYRGTVGRLSRLDPSSWLTYLNPRLSKIICVSDAVREFLLSLKLSPRKLCTIYKGHNPDWYMPVKVDLAQFGIPADAFVVCCVANIRPVKGVDTLLEAFRLIDKTENIHLLLVGRLDCRRSESLINQFKNEGDPRIHHIGFKADALNYTAGSDAFVLVSKEREGLPKSVIEAMCCRVPPIVSSVGGMPELVKDQVSGVVVPADDSAALAKAVLELYNDRALRDRLADGAYSRILKQFNFQNTVELTAGVYSELVA